MKIVAFIVVAFVSLIPITSYSQGKILFNGVKSGMTKEEVYAIVRNNTDEEKLTLMYGNIPSKLIEIGLIEFEFNAQLGLGHVSQELSFAHNDYYRLKSLATVTRVELSTHESFYTTDYDSKVHELYNTLFSALKNKYGEPTHYNPLPTNPLSIDYHLIARWVTEDNIAVELLIDGMPELLPPGKDMRHIFFTISYVDINYTKKLLKELKKYKAQKAKELSDGL